MSGQEVLAPAEAVDSHAQAQLEALQQELREATLAKSEAERRLRAERAQSDRRAIRDARTLASLDAQQRKTKAELAKVRAALLLHAPNCPEALSDGTCARTMRWPYVPGARAARARGEEPASGQGDEQLRQGSLASLEEVLRLLRAEAEPSNEAIANTLDYIGEVQERQGALDPALASYELVLRLRRAAVKKPSDRAIAAALENIGFVQRKLGALETARRKHQEALDLHRKALGDDHPRVALSLLNISDAFLLRWAGTMRPSPRRRSPCASPGPLFLSSRLLPTFGTCVTTWASQSTTPAKRSMAWVASTRPLPSARKRWTCTQLLACATTTSTQLRRAICSDGRRGGKDPSVAREVTLGKTRSKPLTGRPHVLSSLLS